MTSGRDTPRTGAPGVGHIGPWRLEPGPDGVGLRRDPAACAALGEGEPDWSAVEFVPPQGDARRVVLLGESTARGWPFEAALSPRQVLARHLDEVGRFQCVDLAKVGANGEDLLAVARQLTLLAPSIIVSFAGNNWMLSPPTRGDGTINPDAGTGLPAALAAGIRAGGYPGMRAAFAAAMLGDVQEYLDLLVAAHRATGAAVVVVVPEFDLQGFVPPADLQAPVMDPAATQRWHELRCAAEQALTAARPEPVAAWAAEMVALDGGCSPVPGRLAGLAAAALGAGATARAALEQSRDAVVGLMIRHPPRVTAQVQELLCRTADEHGFACVDLRSVLADPRLPELPDPACFLDFCHLSDTGIERVAAAITDAVLDRTVPTARQGPGLAPQARAFGHARAAAHLAFQAQPAPVITDHLRGALRDDPGLAGLLGELRELLAAPQPSWAHPALGRLAARPEVRPFIRAFVGPDAQWPELWLLRACLDDVLGPSAAPGVPVGEIDLLAATGPDGQLLPNWTPGRVHLVSCAASTTLAFALDTPRPMVLELEYRTPWAPPGGTVTVSCGGTRCAELPAVRSWTRTRLAVPVEVTRCGVNRAGLGWPVPHPDLEHALQQDAAALDRGEFPMVLPVFGELYDARLRPAAS